MSGGLPVDAVFVALEATGAATARRAMAVLPGAVLHGRRDRVDDADAGFDDTIGHLQALFRAGRPLVGVCAAGILIRALGPLLDDKTTEPPVLALAADGSAVVPLLGGHRGANAMARVLADRLGGVAALTTAGDLLTGLAVDEPPRGWRVGGWRGARAVAAALLAGEAVGLRIEAGEAAWLRDSGAAFNESARPAILVTDRAIAGAADELVLHPPVLALGVGCERDTEAAELEDLARRTLADAGLTPAAVAGVFSIDLKADEGAVHALARALDVPARFFDAARLEQEAARLVTPSEAVFRETGCHGVAEGAALAAAGPDGVLVVAKVKSRRATCALARAPAAIDTEGTGRPRGRLAIVGIGPGAPGWRTGEAARLVAGATDLVGYGLYLDLVADLVGGRATGPARHEFALGEEEARARHALDLAAAGRSVALLSSGDAGIYAMAAPLFEILDREVRADWNRVEVTVAPGISALQAAAARTGAPLGHDFCAISLSDLLTPRADIERRLGAAAAGDFVVALYNPVSRRRHDLLERARDILLEHRPPATPVILARNLGREGERVEVIELSALESGRADMLTLVIVGSSTTRRSAGGHVYTPRGYPGRRS